MTKFLKGAIIILAILAIGEIIIESPLGDIILQKLDELIVTPDEMITDAFDKMLSGL